MKDRILFELMICFIIGGSIVLGLLIGYALFADHFRAAMDIIDRNQGVTAISILTAGSVVFLWAGRKAR
jgi:hypothetical protein